MSGKTGSVGFVLGLGLVPWAMGLAACGGGAAEGDGPADVVTDGADVVDAAPEDVTGPEDVDGEASDVPPPCVPVCPLSACAMDDGCGGTCAPCPTGLSCEDCPLRIEVVDREEQGGIIRRFSLLLHFLAEDDDPLPEIADIRIGVEGPVKLLEVQAGQPLIDAGKELLGDPNTTDPFQLLADGTVVRVVIASVDAVETIEGGQWLRYDFRLGGAFEAAEEPAVLRILRDEAIFAPPPAEALLWGPGLDDPVAIWPDELQ